MKLAIYGLKEVCIGLDWSHKQTAAFSWPKSPTQEEIAEIPSQLLRIFKTAPCLLFRMGTAMPIRSSDFVLLILFIAFSISQLVVSAEDRSLGIVSLFLFLFLYASFWRHWVLKPRVSVVCIRNYIGFLAIKSKKFSGNRDMVYVFPIIGSLEVLK